MNTNKRLCRTTGTLMWLLLLLAMLVVPTTGRAIDETFDVLQTKTAVYSNVTVTTKSKEYIVIQHASGLTSLKVADLAPEHHQALGYGAIKGSENGSLTVTAKARALVDTIPTQQIEQSWSKHAPAGTPALKLNSTIILAVLGVFVLLYLFFCYCASLICQKVGKPGGLLIWLPVLQYIPLLRAAKMSPLWLLVMPVAHFLWSFRIAGARGKGFFTAILLILPPTYPLAFMYLAFAGGAPSDQDAPPKKISLSGMTFDKA